QITQTNLFRPPYGRIKRSQIKLIQASNKPENINQKPTIIMWDVLSGDFDINLSPEKCLKNILRHTENGSIVVFHDSIKAWETLKYVLPKALENWTKRGYQFKML
ncbi:MAG: polysaccharide deacetylase family protein, partial [Bacteroidetes bacterium]|nr:polysaccharide deacetylase family protein [Bacteroidota bacterium]